MLIVTDARSIGSISYSFHGNFSLYASTDSPGTKIASSPSSSFNGPCVAGFDTELHIIYLKLLKQFAPRVFKATGNSTNFKFQLAAKAPLPTEVCTEFSAKLTDVKLKQLQKKVL